MIKSSEVIRFIHLVGNVVVRCKTHTVLLPRKDESSGLSKRENLIKLISNSLFHKKKIRTISSLRSIWQLEALIKAA